MQSVFYRTLRSLIGLFIANTVSIAAAYKISPLWEAAGLEVATGNAIPDRGLIIMFPVFRTASLPSCTSPSSGMRFSSSNSRRQTQARRFSRTRQLLRSLSVSCRGLSTSARLRLWTSSFRPFPPSRPDWQLCPYLTLTALLAQTAHSKQLLLKSGLRAALELPPSRPTTALLSASLVTRKCSPCQTCNTVYSL